jgi:integrase
MATYNIILDKRYEKKSGKYNVSILLSENKKKIYLNLGIVMNEREYDKVFENRKLTKDSEKIRDEVNKLIIKAKSVYSRIGLTDYKLFRKLMDEDEENSAGQANIRTMTLSELWNEYIQYKQSINTISTGTIDIYRYALRQILKFKGDIKVQEVTSDFLYQFESFYIKTQNSFATLGVHLRTLRAVLKFGMLKSKISSDFVFPFLEYRIRNFQPPKQVLSDSDIQKILEIKEFETHQEEYARNIWLLLYRMHGINFIDLVGLKWTQKQGNYFLITRYKTKNTRRINPRPIKVKISEKIQELLDIVGKETSPYVLGLLHKVDFSESYLKNATKRNRRTINQNLKKISEKIGLQKPLRISHSRDAFATSLKRGGMDILAISEYMNHANPQTTLNHYLDTFDDDKLDEVGKILK